MTRGNPGVSKTPEHNVKNSLAHKGKKRPEFSEEWKRNMSIAHVGLSHPNPHSEEWKINQSNKMLGNRNWRISRGQPTKIELNLQDILSIFPDVEFYKDFGRFEVDAYVPCIHTAFEADGEYWHQDEEKEKRRDSYLEENFALKVIHVSERELLTWK